MTELRTDPHRDHAPNLDCAAIADQIEVFLIQKVGRVLRRRGAVIGISGGVDSAVCACLAVRALGAGRVFGLLMPERDFSADGTERGEALCGALGIKYELIDIAPGLETLGCYRRRDDAIRQLFPEYDATYRQKICIADGTLDSDRVSYFNLVIEAPDGTIKRRRMPHDVYLNVVAATNMKQRTRKLIEYHAAERLNYAVLGTPNRLEYELGFFVRGGDGLADIKPIAHLYKTEVYALAEYLDVPVSIRSQPPSTDTYSMPQTQEEFYFGLPFELMDRVLHAYLNDVTPANAAVETDLSLQQVLRAYHDIASKRRKSRELRREPLMLRAEPAN